MTYEAIKAWAREHDVKILSGGGGFGFAREWDDYVFDNGRRHLTVICREQGIQAAATAVRQLCEMHQLPLPKETS